MLIIAVTFTIHEAHVEAFRNAVLANAKASLEEETGCVIFDVSESKSVPVFFLYEQYLDDEAFRFHLQAPHFLEFDKLSAPWVKDKKVDRYYLLGGAPS